MRAMEDVIRALLGGASDQSILDMLEKLETDSEATGGESETQEFVSCVKVGGSPILPPVMTEERRLQCLQWRRKALDVEERIGNRRRRLLAENIKKIAVGVLNRNNTSSPAVEEEEDNEGLAVYEVLRSNSRAADVALNNFNPSVDLQSPTKISPGPASGDEAEQVEQISPPPNDNDLSEASNKSIAAPSSFAEMKKLVATLPRTPRSARFQSKLMSPGPSSDISSSDEDTTTATSLKTEVNDEDLFSLRSVVTRRKRSPEQSNIYDSLVSVDTVIENKDYREEEGNIEPQVRPRRGSYSLSKPSPVLLAYIQKMGNAEIDDIANDNLVSTANTQPPTSKTEVTVRSSSNDRREARQEFISGLSKPPAISKPVKLPSLEDELRLELGSGMSSAEICHPPTTTDSETYRTETRPPTTAGSETYRTEPTLTASTAQVTPEKLKLAVNRLARQQQESLDQLIRQQEAARLRLREEFQKQQQELMAEIFSQFPQLKASEDGAGRLEDVEAGLERSIKEVPCQDTSSVSEAPELEHDMSWSSDISQSEAEGDKNKENINTANTSLNLIRKGTFTKQDNFIKPPVHVKVPEEALLPRYQPAWARLTALARGHLTRLLLRTEKVEGLRRTIKETVACAVQLHTEAGGEPPSKEDLQLHSRLLAQIESACQSLHNIFFKMDTAERMAVLALNRSAVRERRERRLSGQIGAKKRISAATEARLKAKATSPKVESWDEKRQRVIKNARQNSLLTGRVLTNSNQKTHSARSRSSPRIIRKINLRKSKPILSTKLRQSPLLNLDSPYFKREKPVWK